MYIDVDCWGSSSWRVASTWLFFLIVDHVHYTDSIRQSEINEHLELGRDLLARGQFKDALPHYHAAVEGDPSNYLTLYKRSTIFLALNKPQQALADLDKALSIKPDFVSAMLQRGMIYLRQANLDKALDEFHKALQYDPHNAEAIEGFDKIHRIRDDIHYAQGYKDQRDHHSSIQLLNRILEVCSWSPELRQMRADNYIALGDTRTAISDISVATKLASDNTVGYYKLSLLYYELGEADNSLREIRECLKLDPEHKDCFPHYKKVKKIDKLVNQMDSAVNEKDYPTCIDAGKKILLTETKEAKIQLLAHKKLCHCYLHDHQISLSLSSCKDALAIEKDPHIYCDRAEAHIENEMYDEAIRDYHAALDIDESLQRASEGRARAERLQKQGERRDYYKILGVTRSASKKEVIKAYRKAAQKWHPDNFPDGDEKKKAEKKFIDIAAAKEVLTDPEKRRKFDDGEDPLDPESGQYGGQNGFPFPHGFNHFQGSPFTFKFHFN